METPAPTVYDINSDLLHSSSHINPTLHQSLHVLHFCTLDSLLNYTPYFVINWIEVRAVRRPQISKVRVVTTISDIIVLEAANDAQTSWINTAYIADHSQKKNLSKPILGYRNVYNQIASDVLEIDNPVYKLTTDKPHPVLINVLIRAIF